jgi:hypothetical protein
MIGDKSTQWMRDHSLTTTALSTPTTSSTRMGTRGVVNGWTGERRDHREMSDRRCGDVPFPLGALPLAAERRPAGCSGRSTRAYMVTIRFRDCGLLLADRPYSHSSPRYHHVGTRRFGPCVHHLGKKVQKFAWRRQLPPAPRSTCVCVCVCGGGGPCGPLSD